MDIIKSNEILKQSYRIYNNFDEDEKEKIFKLINLVDYNYDEFIDFFWKFDAEIGEIGGYSFSPDPKGPAPIAKGVGRELFRPLQYARSEFEMHSYPNGRYILDDLGLHLEIVMKFILTKKIINRLKKINRKTLGTLYHSYFKSEIKDIDINENIKDFITIYNRAKHTVNMDPNRERNISIYDGIISYIFIRKLSNELLGPFYSEIYDLIDKYRDRIIISKSMYTKKIDSSKYFKLKY